MSSQFDAAAHSLNLTMAEHRKRQAEALVVYRPMPGLVDFHTSDTIREWILRGGNRSGKTTTAAAQFAAEALGIPITGLDGKPIPLKLPTDRPKTMWVIGIDENHIGMTIFSKLFEGNAYQVIDDEKTGLPRLWDPSRPDDLARKKERRPSGPLIPARFIDPKGWAWYSKSNRAFSICRLKNGTTIMAFSSGGNVPQGTAVDYMWIDEDIANPEAVPDWQARLVDRSGFFVWSAFPWASNEALNNLSDRAEAEEDNPKSKIREQRMSLLDNPYIEEENKQDVIAQWAAHGDTVLAARLHGEFPKDDILMYPEFNRKIHGITREGHYPNCRVSQIMQERDGVPPDDWTRYMALDPGSSKSAIVFAAIPPPEEFGNHMVFYREVFRRSTDAEDMAEEATQYIKGYVFHRWLMDMRAGRQRGMGSGVTVQSYYVDAFKARGLKPESATMFHAGLDKPALRASAVRQGLKIRSSNERPQYLFWLPGLQHTQKEFNLYKRRVVADEYQDDPIAKNNDCLNCIEYLSAPRFRYVKPTRPSAEPSWKATSRQLDQLFGNHQHKKDQFTLGAPT